MKRIAVDMDEVLADALSEHLTRYNRDHGEAITKGQLHGKWLGDIVSADRRERLERYLGVGVFGRAKSFLQSSLTTTRFLSPGPLYTLPILSGLYIGGSGRISLLFRRP